MLCLHSGITPRQAPAAAKRPASPPPPPSRRSPPTLQSPPPPQQAPAAAQRPAASQQASHAQQWGSQGSQADLQPSDAPLVSSRQWLLGLVPRQQFRVVGVSFDDRQSLIPLLRKGALRHGVRWAGGRRALCRDTAGRWCAAAAVLGHHLPTSFFPCVLCRPSGGLRARTRQPTRPARRSGAFWPNACGTMLYHACCTMLYHACCTMPVHCPRPSLLLCQGGSRHAPSAHC